MPIAWLAWVTLRSILEHKAGGEESGVIIMPMTMHAWMQAGLPRC